MFWLRRKTQSFCPDFFFTNSLQERSTVSVSFLWDVKKYCDFPFHTVAFFILCYFVSPFVLPNVFFLPALSSNQTQYLLSDHIASFLPHFVLYLFFFFLASLASSAPVASRLFKAGAQWALHVSSARVTVMHYFFSSSSNARIISV